MIGRLVAALALLVSALVLGSASPAAACSCARLPPSAYAERADFAFVGTTTRERATDTSAIYRFTVDTVYVGEVRRTQDVVTPSAPGDAVDSCEERLPVGTTRGTAAGRHHATRAGVRRRRGPADLRPVPGAGMDPR